MYDDDTWLGSQPLVNLQCRDTHHHWNHYEAKWQKDLIFRTLLCARCGAEKDQYLLSDGRLLKTVCYRYPRGYLHPAGGLSQNQRSKLRLKSMGLD